MMITIMVRIIIVMIILVIIMNKLLDRMKDLINNQKAHIKEWKQTKKSRKGMTHLIIQLKDQEIVSMDFKIWNS